MTWPDAHRPLISFKIQAARLRGDGRYGETVNLSHEGKSLRLVANGAKVTVEAPMKKDELPFPPHEMIPGERDPSNLTHREPGSIGGRFTGEDIPPSSHLPWLDEATASEHAHEGGLPANKSE